MKNRYILTDLEKYVVFVDKDNQETLYAMTKDELQRKHEILKDYDQDESKAPDNITLNVFQMGIVGKSTSASYDNYDIVSMNPINFPINRLHWIFIQLVPR